ncbi:MAG TPA: hypothetical protein VN817_09640, partial [Solirubrobacteraceae bacterium]|nr:hypothetical protein [Solirubrobacteraceae bacterium]
MTVRSHRPRPSLAAHRALLAAVTCAAFAAAAGSASAPASADAAAGGYAPGRILVKYAAATSPSTRTAIASSAGAGAPKVSAPHTRVLSLARGVSIAAALRRLRAQRDVVWAVPDYRAHLTGTPG